MSRKRVISKREVLPDPKFNNPTAAKFINSLMRQGKKSTAQAILYDALEIVRQKSKDDPLSVFQKAVGNVKPVVEVKSRRVGGSTYQVPTEVKPSRSSALGMRWLISFAKARGEKSMAARLAGELMDAASGRGASVKKREDTHKMADANKAFAHYRW